MRDELFGLYFKDQPIFEGLDEGLINRVYSIARHTVLSRRTRIEISAARQPGRLYFLVKGKLKLTSRTKENTMPVKDILFPGEIFGNLTLNQGTGHEHADVLVNNTIVYSFNSDEFRGLINLHHRLALNYAHFMTRKFNILKERYEIWTRSDTKSRFVYLLRKWADAEGKANGQYVLLNNPVSLTDIADILSISRQFMHKMLKEMKEAGTIQYSRRQIAVCKNLLQPFSSN